MSLPRGVPWIAILFAGPGIPCVCPGVLLSQTAHQPPYLAKSYFGAISIRNLKALGGASSCDGELVL